jgi:Terpene synthase family 2, C-terminal metal binding
MAHLVRETETWSLMPVVDEATAEAAGDLDLPYPPQLSPDIERARRHNRGWMLARGLVPSPAALAAYDRWRMDRLTARAYPMALGPALDLATDWMGWFFIFDDQFDGPLRSDPGAAGMVCQEMASLTEDTVPACANPLATAFRDLWLRSVAGMSEAWRRRFRLHWKRYFAFHRWEAQCRRSGIGQDLEGYLARRRDGIGIPVSLDLHERTAGVELTGRLHDEPPMRIMRDCCADVVLLVNDLFSAAKERAAGDVVNSVLLLAGGSRAGQANAAACVRSLVRERIARFAAAEAELAGHRLAARRRAAANVFVAGMKAWMRANFDWSAETARYSAEGVAAASRPRPWSGLIPVPNRRYRMSVPRSTCPDRPGT